MEKEKTLPFWERFNQTLSKYIPAEDKMRKNKNSEDFLLNTKQVFSGRNLENFSYTNSSASSLNLCPQNQLAQVTNSRS